MVIASIKVKFNFEGKGEAVLVGKGVVVGDGVLVNGGVLASVRKKTQF
jgi:hypothetical protein